MDKPLWQPSAERISQSRLQDFIRMLDDKNGQQFDDYEQLHQWSIEEPAQFWQHVWDFCDIQAASEAQQVLTQAEQFPGAQWFQDARLNFAENLLRNRSDKIAIVARLENAERRELSYQQLYHQVAQMAAGLRATGVETGDRVAGFMPNIPETIVAMLATASIGAIWSSCSPDFGLNGVKDRFGQIKPKVLIATDGYFYAGKTIALKDRLVSLCDQIESIEKLVVISLIGDVDNFADVPCSVSFDDFLIKRDTPDLRFEALPFDHPLYIMYSSGTTGVPKCIVHGAGGTLLQHLKEHRLHCDIKPDDVVFYFTTCGWMMWNWLVSVLASEATVALYDGSPFYPSPSTLLDMLEQERISVFGTSAKYIAAIEKENLLPRESHDLSALKSILSTGSPLSPGSFHYVYESIKEDVCLSSISGGTDIVSCFVLGNPTLPVWQGEIQCRGLGMAVEFWDDEGNALLQGKGEMVCTRPFPSAPICFWNDPDDKKYRAAYFDKYPNVWAHGDYGERTQHGGVIIHGRSDAVLNPGGVRIGTAEIYRQVEKVDEVMDSICIGQEWHEDIRVVLFVVLREGVELDDALQDKIRQTIRQETSPRHVPQKVIAVADIPRTISGKIVELAVRNVVHGEAVKNTDALANPQALAYFKNLPQLQ